MLFMKFMVVKLQRKILQNLFKVRGAAAFDQGESRTERQASECRASIDEAKALTNILKENNVTTDQLVELIEAEEGLLKH